MGNKLCKLLLLTSLVFIITGCQSKSNSTINSNKIDSKKYNTSGLKYITCKTDATAEGIDKITIKYEVFYNKDKYIEIFRSLEKLESKDEGVLKTYQTAYEKLANVYNKLDYYDINIEKEDNILTKITYINYGKIDMEKLIDIEGTEDNVTIKDGKIKLSDWKIFAKKYGTSCEDEE